MNATVERLLSGEADNHIMPFFWQHGEDEATLRKYMGVIADSNCGAVCVESRPHPDFCGPRWWRDMDIILDEARGRGMKVWILDDSHFPTGYANGALKTAPIELCRQSVYCKSVPVPPGEAITVKVERLIHPKFRKSFMEKLMLRPMRRYEDDRLLSAVAICADRKREPIDLTGLVSEGRLTWRAPAGEWRIWVSCLTRNLGPHREYINMLDSESCLLLLDAVYEPHFAHYSSDFGRTIAGFFSDEPELGNFHLWKGGNVLGTDQDLPWGRALPSELERRLGGEWPRLIPLLWENEAEPGQTARVRYAYMDAVTRLVEGSFSRQMGDWCRGHGVQYIGHVIEDNNQHARTGVSLGHFFRGLSGQDMSGVDVIANQVLPQAEDQSARPERDSEFFHYALGKLGSSQAAIDPGKRGRAMCELFGNYGWGAGVRTQKYVADHFLAQGINYFVPHAFSPKRFPDPDSPPHFYAGGHDAQIRHFGRLMLYMNRVCNLTSGGSRPAPIAILYHAEAEWTGSCMLMQKPARILTDNQIDFDFLPADVFSEPERYRTVLDSGLAVNAREYKALVVPSAQFITAALAAAIERLNSQGFPVLFLDYGPEGICDGEQSLLEGIASCPIVPLDGLVEHLERVDFPRVRLEPASDKLRVMRYSHDGELFLLVNEASVAYRGRIRLPVAGPCCAYDAWDNRLERLQSAPDCAGTALSVTIQPSHSLIVVFGEVDAAELPPPIEAGGMQLAFTRVWRRRLCPGISYPRFGAAKKVKLPDDLAREHPLFSGYARYENGFLAKGGEGLVIEIDDAAEGVEVFVNGESAGMQIVPPFVFDLSALAKAGDNELAIEVATTLARRAARNPLSSLISKLSTDSRPNLSGITGEVKLYRR
jgi:Glycosyl hydrolases family 2, sugar binding domain.